jgi:hypothetical protein
MTTPNYDVTTLGQANVNAVFYNAAGTVTSSSFSVITNSAKIFNDVFNVQSVRTPEFRKKKPSLLPDHAYTKYVRRYYSPMGSLLQKSQPVGSGN